MCVFRIYDVFGVVMSHQEDMNQIEGHLAWYYMAIFRDFESFREFSYFTDAHMSDKMRQLRNMRARMCVCT